MEDLTAEQYNNLPQDFKTYWDIRKDTILEFLNKNNKHVAKKLLLHHPDPSPIIAKFMIADMYFILSGLGIKSISLYTLKKLEFNTLLNIILSGLISYIGAEKVYTIFLENNLPTFSGIWNEFLYEMGRETDRIPIRSAGTMRTYVGAFGKRRRSRRSKKGSKNQRNVHNFLLIKWSWI